MSKIVRRNPVVRGLSYVGWGAAGAFVVVGAFVFTPLVIAGSAVFGLVRR